MAMGRSEGVQGDLMATWAEMPRSPGHAFYDRLQELLRGAGFDAFVEGVCRSYYAPRMGAPSLPPGRYFRMHMIGYFEGIDSERGIAWRCADSFSLRDFLRLSNRDKAPDHSWLSRTRSRLPHEAHEKVEAGRRARPGEGRANRRRRLDDGGQRRAAHDRAARQRRELSRDADEDGERERDRHAERRGPGALRPQAQGQDAVERGLEEPDRPRGEDRQDEGRDDASGLQTGARGRSRHRRRGGGADPFGRRRRHDDAFSDPRGGGLQSRRGRPRAEPGRALRPRGRQGLSCARPVEGARRRRLEDAHRRARAGQWLSSLAWRRGGPESRLRQPGAAEIGDRA